MSALANDPLFVDAVFWLAHWVAPPLLIIGVALAFYRFRFRAVPWVIYAAVVYGLVFGVALTGRLEHEPLFAIFIFATMIIYWAGYGLVVATMYLLPAAAAAAALLGGMWFLRKLVLDAVKEARRDPAQRQ